MFVFLVSLRGYTSPSAVTWLTVYRRPQVILQQASIEPEWLNNYLYDRATEMASARDPSIRFR